MYVAPVMTAKVQEVHREANPQVNARNPDQHCVLKARGEVWIFCVPCQIPILRRESGSSQRKNKLRTSVFEERNSHYLSYSLPLLVCLFTLLLNWFHPVIYLILFHFL